MEAKLIENSQALALMQFGIAVTQKHNAIGDALVNSARVGCECADVDLLGHMWAKAKAYGTQHGLNHGYSINSIAIGALCESCLDRFDLAWTELGTELDVLLAEQEGF